MSAIFRAPTINRLQRFLTTRTLPSSLPSPRRLPLHPRQTTSSPFSTSRIVRNKTNTNTSGSNNTKGNVDADANGNPAYPKFNLRSIVPNPRVRKALIAAFGVMVVMESWMWITYWPKIMGWWQREEGSDGKRAE